MPELPEVETVTNSVKKHLLNNTFSDLIINWPKVLDNFDINNFQNKVSGKKILNVLRRGKYIIIDLESCILAVHLRMTGKLYVSNHIDHNSNHVSAYFSLKKGFLIFEDTRKFGRIYLYKDISILNSKLGIEPLSKQFTLKWLVSCFKNKHRQIKPFLLNQAYLVGMGNIYTDEALWIAKIHPLSKCDEIKSKNIELLHAAVIKVLSDSIKLGGTTIRDYTYDYSYVGNYALNLNAYGRNDKPCNRCSTKIIKLKVAQRGTYICPKCQVL
tara:strand:+ start:314 stop:1123 length:810 start_codon:yes stop_codon:yes gene_type:complete